MFAVRQADAKAERVNEKTGGSLKWAQVSQTVQISSKKRVSGNYFSSQIEKKEDRDVCVWWGE